MFNQPNVQNIDDTDCADLSALALFQLIVYGNDTLMLQEKKSFESVCSPNSVSSPRLDLHAVSESMITHNPYTPDPPSTLSCKSFPISFALNDAQNALDSLNKCKHERVTRSCQEQKDSTLHYIECDECGKEVYHYAERTQQQQKCNSETVIEIKKEIIRTDNEWYDNVYRNCKHPETFRDNTVCKQCGQCTYFILD